MATANCTVNSFRSYNNGWTSWQTPSTKILGAYCFGKFTSNNQNFYRYLVIKITTPTYPTGASAKKLNINIPLWRTSAGTDTWYCAITTTNSTSCPTTWVTSRSIYNTNSYTTRTFTTNEFNFISNTTYYVWLYSPTPVGNSTVGTYANNHSYGANGAKISVSTTYTVDTASGNFKKPGLPKLYGYKGSYSGCQIIIPKSDFDTQYPDIFVGNSPTGIYYRRTTVTETSDGWIFNIDASTSVRTLYITRRKLNSDGSHAANAAFNISANYYQLYTPPLYACQIYCNSDTPLIFDSKSESGNTYVIDGLTAKGLTTSPTSTTPEISITSGLAWSTNGTKLEGKTWYMLYDSTKSYTLYCGGPTAHTLSGSRRHYGTGDIEISSCKLDGATTISDIMDLPACESNSAFDLLCCLVEEENINYSDARSNGVASYIDHRAAFHSSSETLYTIYKKTPPESVNITHYYLTDSIETMTQSVEYELSCHGKGAYHNDFYNKSHIVHGAAVCPINWKMVGWKKDGDNNIYPWGNLVDISLPYVISDIYQIITPDNSVYFGNSSWKNIKIYYGVNNKWVPTLIRQGNNNKWNGGKVTTFTLGDITYQVDKGMTWAEWCNSGYNSSGFKIDENSIKVNGAKVIIAASGEDVLPSYTIVTDQGYYAFYEENNWIEPDSPNLNPIT